MDIYKARFDAPFRVTSREAVEADTMKKEPWYPENNAGEGSQVVEKRMERASQFNPRWFASEGHERDAGEWPTEDRLLFRAIRATLPELDSWGDLPIGVAWGSYSQDVWLVSWMDDGQHSLDRKGLIPFLAYIHYHEKNGRAPEWGTSVEDIVSYAAENGLS